MIIQKLTFLTRSAHFAGLTIHFNLLYFLIIGLERDFHSTPSSQATTLQISLESKACIIGPSNLIMYDRAWLAWLGTKSFRWNNLNAPTFIHT